MSLFQDLRLSFSKYVVCCIFASRNGWESEDTVFVKDTMYYKYVKQFFFNWIYNGFEDYSLSFIMTLNQTKMNITEFSLFNRNVQREKF